MNRFIKILITILMIGCLSGCTTWDNLVIDTKSDWNNGMNRTLIVYTADGKILREFKGKLDLEINDGGYVKFNYQGKRYIYYNCYVETIADID